MNRYGLIAVIAKMSFLNQSNTIVSPRYVLVTECAGGSFASAEDYFEGFRYQLDNIELQDNEKIVGTQIMRLEN